MSCYDPDLMGSIQDLGKAEDYQRLLRDELEQRCAKNAKYSLRAFARDLGVSPSHLSGIFSRRYGLSREGALAIGKKIGLKGSEAEFFVQSVESQHARSKVMRTAALEKLKSLKIKPSHFSRLELDHFQAISDWYHFAILELTYTKNFQPSIKWVAKSLGIHPVLVSQAIGRLTRLKLMKIKGKAWCPSEEVTETGFGTPSVAIRSFHDQILSLAKEALYFQPVENRDFRSTILAIRKDRLPEAKKQLEALHRDFCIDVSGTAYVEKDEVYCLSTQLFSLTPHQEIK